MDVIFNFPNGQTLSFKMNTVPRVGDLVDLSWINQTYFTANQWYEFEEYKSYTWQVERVVWTPRYTGAYTSYVNLILKRVDKPTN
jgi:hypothetical protein